MLASTKESKTLPFHLDDVMETGHEYPTLNDLAYIRSGMQCVNSKLENFHEWITLDIAEVPNIMNEKGPIHLIYSILRIYRSQVNCVELSQFS